MNKQPCVAIVGAGASGLAAALTLHREGFSGKILLLERMDRVGKKILSTGNGRCNLGNIDLSPRHYHSRNPKALQAALEEMPLEKTQAFFQNSGLLLRQEEGRLYPLCNQAAMVLDVLRLELEDAGIPMHTQAPVSKIDLGKHGYRLTLGSGEVLQATWVILATGGKAAPKLGSDGSGYDLARSLGHTVTPLYPALVPIKGRDRIFHGLKGVRAQGKVRLCRGKEILAQEQGEIQFTDYGLSGIPLLQLSCLLPQAGDQGILSLDLLPEQTFQQVEALLAQRAHESRYATLEQLLLGTIPKKLAFALLKSLGFASLSRTVDTLKEQELRRIARALKDWPMEVSGTLGWDQAQVTGGGVALEEIFPQTMESKRCPGLYLTGELLDVVGDCGGYNLHWAWNTGRLAGEAIAAQERAFRRS